MTKNTSSQKTSAVLSNGAGAAALLAAGWGALVLAVVALVADKAPAVKAALNIWKPTGPLSGVTTLAVVVWLASWLVLDRWWSGKTVNLSRMAAVALTLLGLSVVLTFPPVVDLF
jgi:hypothetical protein